MISPNGLDELRGWIAAHVAAQAGIAPADIRADRSLADYGLDSVYAATLAADIEDALGVEVDPGVALASESVGQLADALLATIEKERGRHA